MDDGTTQNAVQQYGCECMAQQKSSVWYRHDVHGILP
jgi:hypothetical protein